MRTAIANRNNPLLQKLVNTPYVDINDVIINGGEGYAYPNYIPFPPGASFADTLTIMFKSGLDGNQRVPRENTKNPDNLLTFTTLTIPSAFQLDVFKLYLAAGKMDQNQPITSSRAGGLIGNRQRRF